MKTQWLKSKPTMNCKNQVYQVSQTYHNRQHLGYRNLLWHDVQLQPQFTVTKLDRPTLPRLPGIISISHTMFHSKSETTHYMPLKPSQSTYPLTLAISHRSQPIWSHPICSHSTHSHSTCTHFIAPTRILTNYSLSLSNNFATPLTPNSPGPNSLSNPLTYVPLSPRTIQQYHSLLH